MCWEGELPDALSRVMRKARKAHKCDECGLAIQPGTVYEYVSGIWDGEPSHYKTCEGCQILRAHVREEDGCDEDPPLGMLLEAANEVAHERQPRDMKW